MHNLSKALQLYVVERLHSQARWTQLQVIFSDASVPGEGEHKILDFIRSQRASPNYNANTSHCIYGADADLIMLGLSTHEPHFYVLRENIMQDKDKKCRRCNKTGHLTHECGTDALKDTAAQRQAQLVQFQFVKISVVREYLYLEFKDVKLPFAFDFERIVDDFVFLCFFVGNDFLPHLPSLSIREGALDALVFIYKHLLPSMGGYLSKGSGELNFTNIDVLLNDLARVEEDFFRQHQKNAKFNEERRKRDEERDAAQNEVEKQLKAAEQKREPVKWRNNDKRAAPEQAGQGPSGESTHAPTEYDLTDYDKQKMTAEQFELHGKTLVLEDIMKRTDLTDDEKQKLAGDKLKDIVKKQMREVADQKVEAYTDTVKFGSAGWKERYYYEKFDVVGVEAMKQFTSEIRQSYIEGLAWVFAYYYNGCKSWHWFYPYHYAPFASDLLGCDSLEIKFEQGEPAKPFEQLLSVFPKQSCHAVPACYRKLYEPDSAIIDFYPSEVKLDINGARYAWMGVNLLSFIERPRLVKAMNEADGDESKLTPHEKERNRRNGDIRLFFRPTALNKDSKAVKQLLANGGSALEIEASF